MARVSLSPLKQTPRVVGSGSLSRPSRPGRTSFVGPVISTPSVVSAIGSLSGSYRKGKNPNTGK
jgi:hypothetical protein